MSFSNYGEEPCVNIWRYCTAVLQIVTFGRQSAKQFTEFQRLEAETVDFLMCDVHRVRKRLCGNKISERSLGAQSDAGMASPGCCREVVRSVRPPLPPLMVGTAQKGHPEGAVLKREFSFDVWSQNQLPAESLLASSWKVFLCK